MGVGVAPPGELWSRCPLAPAPLFLQDSEVQKGMGALRSALGPGQLSALGWPPGLGSIHEGPGSVRGWGLSAQRVSRRKPDARATLICGERCGDKQHEAYGQPGPRPQQHRHSKDWDQ